MNNNNLAKMIALGALTTMIVGSAVAKSGSGPDEKCVQFEFLYDDDHTDSGELCGDDASNQLTDGLHVTSLHVSCSDDFAGGTSDKSDLDGHLVTSYFIAWTKDGQPQRQCGTPFDDGSDDDSGDDPGDPSECPSTFSATPNGDASVSLTWAASDADAFQVYRAQGDADAVLLKELDGNATGFLDASAQAGTTYTYTLMADGQTPSCGALEVTSVPVFPSLMAGAAGIGASLLGYALMRRR